LLAAGRNGPWSEASGYTISGTALRFAEGNFKVHELVAVGVVDSGDEETRALCRVVEVADVKEEKSLL
jgi:hypothetical protein